jgi:hypothetical protein
MDTNEFLAFELSGGPSIMSELGLSESSIDEIDPNAFQYYQSLGGDSLDRILSLQQSNFMPDYMRQNIMDEYGNFTLDSYPEVSLDSFLPEMPDISSSQGLFDVYNAFNPPVLSDGSEFLSGISSLNSDPNSFLYDPTTAPGYDPFAGINQSMAGLGVGSAPGNLWDQLGKTVSSIFSGGSSSGSGSGGSIGSSSASKPQGTDPTLTSIEKILASLFGTKQATASTTGTTLAGPVTTPAIGGGLSLLLLGGLGFVAYLAFKK